MFGFHFTVPVVIQVRRMLRKKNMSESFVVIRSV